MRHPVPRQREEPGTFMPHSPSHTPAPLLRWEALLTKDAKAILLHDDFAVEVKVVTKINLPSAVSNWDIEFLHLPDQEGETE